MINVCLEIKTTCGKCGQPLPVNALVEKVLCSACQTETNFSYEFWNKSILDSVFEEVSSFKDGEGQPSTIFAGQYQFNRMYGKQNPRCGKCKTPVDMSDMNKIDEYAQTGKTACSKCGNEVSVRKLPKEAQDVFTNVKYLIGEDSDLFLSGNNDVKIPNASRLVLFTCPSCGGNLEIDGTDRMVKCKYCSSEIYLPDDLWLRLHPVKTVQRWYLCFDAAAAGVELTDWYYLPDVTIDKEGNLYMATMDSDEEKFTVWSFSPDIKTRWVGDGLKYSEEDTRIALANDGNLYLADKSKFSLLKLSSKDGSTLNTIKGEASSGKNPYSFNMKGCGSFLCDTDGTILALINNEIVRYNSEGKRVSLWGDIREEAKPHGFLSGLANTLSGGSNFHVIPDDPEWAPCVDELHSHPSRCDSNLTKINLGWDGYIYFSDSSTPGYVAKYDRSGKQLWKVALEISADSKACTDSKGNVFVIGMKKDKDNNTNIIRISPDGKHVDAVILDLLQGGELEEEDTLAVAYDGTIYAFKYYNRLKVFSPDFKKTYTSGQSSKDDAEALKRKKDKIENDEEK